MSRPHQQDPDAPFVPSKRINAEGFWWILLLLAAALIGAAVVLVVFVERGVASSPDAQLLAASRSQPGNIVPLIQAGADPNQVDPQSGETPLTLAITLMNYESAKLLLENGADPNLPGPQGPPLLSPYLNYGDASCLPIIELLLDHKADPNATGTFNQTPLHLAAEAGNLILVNHLLIAGADINALSAQGTALHIARRYGHADVEQALIDAGADDSIPDPGGTAAPGVGTGGGFY